MYNTKPVQPGLSSLYLVLNPQKLGITRFNPGSGPPASFLFLISNTLRWLFEWTSPEKVGLHAGLYSGKSRPDLNRTPHALHRVLAPSGPVLHCGVFWTWQWLHLLWNCTPTEPSTPVWTAGFFFCFLVAGSPTNTSALWTGLLKIRQGVENENPEEQEDDDDGEDEDGYDQTRLAGLQRLLLGFTGTCLGNHVGLDWTGLASGSDGVKARASGFWVPTGWSRERSNRESSAKWETHSSPAKSSSCKTQKNP